MATYPHIAKPPEPWRSVVLYLSHLLFHLSFHAIDCICHFVDLVQFDTEKLFLTLTPPKDLKFNIRPLIEANFNHVVTVGLPHLNIYSIRI